MTIMEQLLQKASALTPACQLQALHFVDSLAQQQAQEGSEESYLSLTMALRGMENESWPEYTESDYLEKWQ